MSKKNKKKKSQLKPTSPIKVVLPVVISLVVIFVISLVLALVSTPIASAKVDNPNKAYASMGKYKVTNQELYESLRGSAGITVMTQLVDEKLLKDVTISDTDYENAYNDLVYGSELLAEMKTLSQYEEELSELDEGTNAYLLKQSAIEKLSTEVNKEKGEAIATFEFNCKYMGLDTEAKVRDYITLLAKRDVYTKQAYSNWVKNGNDFDNDKYIEAYKNAHPDEVFEKTANVIAISFTTSAQAKAYLELLSTPIYKDDLSNGWKKINDQVEITTLNGEINTLKGQYDSVLAILTFQEDIQKLEEEIFELETEIDELNDQITELESAEEPDVEAIEAKTTERNTKQEELDNKNNEKGQKENELAAIKTGVEEAISTLEAEIDVLDIQIEALDPEEDAEAIEAKTTEKDAKQEELDSKRAELLAIERVYEIQETLKDLKAPEAMTDKEVAEAFIELYNIYYAYYRGGNVDEYFNKDEEGKKYTTLKDEYKLLVEDIHYTIEDDGVVFDIDALKALSETYVFPKFEYTSTEATNLLSSAIFDTLKVLTSEEAEEETDEEETIVNYTYSPVSAKPGYYYFAYLFNTQEGNDKSQLETLIESLESSSDEEKTTIQGQIDEIKNALRDTLIDENYSSDQESRFLLELRQKHNLKIYDRYINATYQAAYNYLYETTLKITDYPTYEGDGGKNKKLSFSFEDLDNNTVEYSAQAYFEQLQISSSVSGIVTALNNYALLNNEEFNTVYNPYTKKIYDKARYKELMSTDYQTIYTQLYSGSIKSVKAFKFAFENDLFKTYGFEKSYGWENFMSDYLLVRDEKFLVASLILSECEDAYYLTKYDYNKIKSEMQKIYDNYYSMKVVNMVVSTDYNRDKSPDSYNVDDANLQEYWTAYQQGLVQELSDLFYEAERLSATEASGLANQLKKIVEEYNDATYQDITWGKYIAAGLYVSAESSADYTSQSSLVQEFHDEMAKVYKAIEASEGYTLGEWTDDEKTIGYQDEEVFTTSYGYHRVTIIDANERVYVNSEKSTDLSTLTIDLYKQYLDNKESLDSKVVTAIETYFTPALTSVADSITKNLLKQELRMEIAKEVIFSSDAKKTQYEQLEQLYKEFLESQVEDNN